MLTMKHTVTENGAGRDWMRRAVFGLAMVVAVMGSSFPLASPAGAAPIREADSVGLACRGLRNEANTLVAEYKNAGAARREQILTRLEEIGRHWNAASCRARYGDVTETAPSPRPDLCRFVRCDVAELPPGKVDPGRPAPPPALPAPAVVFTGREAYATPGGQWVRHGLDITNWNRYDAALFTKAPHLPACGQNPNAARTWVDILTVDGRRLYGYCGIGEPGELRSLSFAIAQGDDAPKHVVVRLTDRQTRRVVTSNPVPIPAVSRVTTAYTAAEHANMHTASEYWDVPVRDLQKTGVMAVRFIHGIAGTTGSDPLRPRPDVSGPVRYTSQWTDDDQHALNWVSDYYDLTYAETQKLGTAVMIFFAALGQQ